MSPWSSLDMKIGVDPSLNPMCIEYIDPKFGQTSCFLGPISMKFQNPNKMNAYIPYKIYSVQFP